MPSPLRFLYFLCRTIIAHEFLAVVYLEGFASSHRKLAACSVVGSYTNTTGCPGLILKDTMLSPKRQSLFNQTHLTLRSDKSFGNSVEDQAWYKAVCFADITVQP